MDGATALWDGFSSFFSIWQICVLQISPFFMAFIIGAYLTTFDKTAKPSIVQWALLPCIAFGVGFTIFYSLLIASGLSFGRLLTYNIGNLRIVAGIVILLIALYLLFIERMSALREKHHPLLLNVLALLLGISFALVYSPCITPTLSEIMGIASQRQTAITGWYLAVFYGIGLCLALGITAITLISILRSRAYTTRNYLLIKNICGVIVLIPAVLNITGLMRHYKAFILGFLV